MPLSSFINHTTLKANLSPECLHRTLDGTRNSLFAFQSPEEKLRSI